MTLGAVAHYGFLDALIGSALRIVSRKQSPRKVIRDLILPLICLPFTQYSHVIAQHAYFDTAYASTEVYLNKPSNAAKP